MDLTGKWQQVGGAEPDHGDYFIRTTKFADGSPIGFWWHGEQTGGKEWRNVCFGTAPSEVGDTFGVNWADITEGANRGYGTLTLKLTTADQIDWVADNNGNGGTYFGGRRWERVK